MNNEPVAWMQTWENQDGVLKHTVNMEQIGKQDIPLYTHPAKELYEQFKKGFEAGKEEGWKAHKFHHPAKTLTIEEISEVSKEIFKGYKNFYHYQINFARAILKKASEK